jgi:hypothetical protein
MHLSHLHVSCLLRIFVTKLCVYLELENIIGDAKDRCVQATTCTFLHVDRLHVYTSIHGGHMMATCMPQVIFIVTITRISI